MEKYLSLGITYGIKIVGVILALILAFIIAGWLRRLTLKLLRKVKFDETISKALAGLVKVVVIVFAIIGCLGVFGIETTSFAALIAAAGLAVGLAFQGTLSNFASGVMILIFRPFKVGDYVNIGGEVGIVDEIKPFETMLDTSDNRRLIIPNSKIYGATIQNITYHDKRRIELKVSVAGDSSIENTRSVLIGAAESVNDTLREPVVEAVLEGLNPAKADWELRVWCKGLEYNRVREAVIIAMRERLAQANITML